MTEESTTFGDGESITEAIIDAICTLQGIEPEEFDYVLYDWVDPDALTKLLGNASERRSSITVEFTISEFRITVSNEPARDDVRVSVRKAPREAALSGVTQEGVQEI